MKKPGLLIRTDGEMRRITVDTSGKGGRRQLQDYYDAIDTDIVERVSAKALGGAHVYEIWCDEEGYRNRKRPNAFVALIFGRPIVGDVIVHGRSLPRLFTSLEGLGYEIGDEDE